MSKEEKEEHSSESEKSNSTGLPASWDKVNQVYKAIDNAFNDALKKYNPTTYEVFLVIACLKYKLYTVETKGFFHEELMQVIQQSQEEMKGIVNLDPKDIYK